MTSDTFAETMDRVMRVRSFPGWSVLGLSLARNPEKALALAERALEDPSALSEASEALLLTADPKSWSKARAAHQAALASSVGIRTGTVMDALETETGGNVTAEAVEAYFDRLKAGIGG